MLNHLIYHIILIITSTLHFNLVRFFLNQLACFAGDDDEREGRAREEDERAAAGHEDPQALRLGTELPPRGRDHQEHRTSYTNSPNILLHFLLPPLSVAHWIKESTSYSFLKQDPYDKNFNRILKPVCRIRDILVRIRIRRRIPVSTSD